jgi:predicted RecA/RadA family phage recombinase
MKNFVEAGDTVTFIAPTGGAVSGTPLVIGSLVVIPAWSAAEGFECEGVTCGVYALPKKSTDTPDQFAKAYWDETNGEVTTTDTDNTLIGVFMHTLVTGTTEAHVRLNGTSV